MSHLPRRLRFLALAGCLVAVAGHAGPGHAGSGLAGPGLAGELSSDISPCGGDAYSTAEVIEGRPPRRGPLVAMPDTLCADLAPQQPANPVEIYVDPYGYRGGGYRGGDAPYGGETQRGVRPSGRPLRSGD